MAALAMTARAATIGSDEVFFDSALEALIFAAGSLTGAVSIGGIGVGLTGVTERSVGISVEGWEISTGAVSVSLGGVKIGFVWFSTTAAAGVSFASSGGIGAFAMNFLIGLAIGGGAILNWLLIYHSGLLSS